MAGGFRCWCPAEPQHEDRQRAAPLRSPLQLRLSPPVVWGGGEGRGSRCRRAALPRDRLHNPEAQPRPMPSAWLMPDRRSLSSWAITSSGGRDHESEHPVQHLSQGPGLMALIIQGDGGPHGGWPRLLMRPREHLHCPRPQPLCSSPRPHPKTSARPRVVWAAGTPCPPLVPTSSVVVGGRGRWSPSAP